MERERTLKEKITDKLKETGLTAHAKKMGLKSFSSDQAQVLHPSLDQRGGIFIPYFDRHGKRREDTFRVRYLESPRGGFKVKNPPKYGQPAGSPPAAYFYPLIDWKPVLESSAAICITEGEFKAACACSMGYPTIGLGGVYSFQSAKRGIDFLPELDEIDWKDRRVYVIYDSDIVSKPEVQLALNRLCARLTERGAVTKVVKLPSSVYGGQDKVGLDDYLMKHGKRAFEDLLEKAESDPKSRALNEMNDRFAWLGSQMAVVDFTPDDEDEICQFVRFHDFAKGAYYPGFTIGPRGGKVLIAQEWLHWEHRRTIKKLVYQPGEPSHFDGSFNVWRGWGTQPEKGDVRPFMDLLRYMMPQEDRRQWFLSWLAYPLQNPGAKLLSSSVLWGLHAGVGKSFIGLTMGDIYGDKTNFISIQSDHLEDRFNDWIRFKQFVMVDEAREGKQLHSMSSKLKQMITSEKVRVNEKYQKPYMLEDTTNYYFTSNQVRCLDLESGDRRFFIHQVKVAPKPPSYYDKLDAWRKGKGPAALFHHLLYAHDLKGFDPKGHAFHTDDKVVMAKLGEVSSTAFLRELMESEDESRDLYTMADLQTAFVGRYPQQRCDSNITWGRSLAALECEKRFNVYLGKGITPPLTTLYAVRNRAKWSKEPNPTWAGHYIEALKRSGQVTDAANVPGDNC